MIKISRLFSLLVVLIFTLLPFSYASLSCEGEGQTFFAPDLIEKSTTSIPCTLYISGGINASCIASTYFENELISTYPSIEDVDLYGRTHFIKVISESDYQSFVVDIPNKDLLHNTHFNWKVLCKDSNGDSYSSIGNITTEYPFAEPIVDRTINVFWGSNTLLISLAFVLFIIGAIIVVAKKMM